MALKTPYALPFAVTYPDTAFFSVGQDVSVVVRLQAARVTEAVPVITSVMATFVALANQGGLAGRFLDPARSGIATHTSLQPSPHELSHRLERCWIDDGALLVLCMMLLHRDVAPFVESVRIAAPGPSQRLTPDARGLASYPERAKQLPFAVDDEQPESGAYTFVLELEQPLLDQNRDVLESGFAAWTACVLAGGFSLWPLPPEQSYVEPDDPFIDFDARVEWTVFKLRADAAAIDALLGVLAAFHARGQRIATVRVQ